MFKLQQDPLGDYINPCGERFNLLCCRRFRGKEGINVGWLSFTDTDEAVSYWGLKLLSLFESISPA